MEKYHQTVLLKESIDALNLKKNGVYVDATLGGGGHTREILRRKESVKVFAFDRDADAILRARKLFNDEKRIQIFQDNFLNLRTKLALNFIKKIDGIIFDLGVSSHQFDVPERGFSFSLEGELDMRMGKQTALTAKQVVNSYPVKQLREIFWEFGEEKESYRIARGIAREREKREINTTRELAEIIDKNTYSSHKLKAKARIFQALRIYINEELAALKTALNDSLHLLKHQGRMVVISYHSLEDRIVKNFFKYQNLDCVCPPEFPQCCCDKVSRLKIITKKPIVPTKTEIDTNKRARSAKMRIGEKREI